MSKGTICIDAGHYGEYNQSPVVPEYYESKMTWKLQNLLKKYLVKHGFGVITTRTKQASDLSLEARGKKAENCILFLSLHSDAFKIASSKHVSVFYPFDNLNNSVVLARMLRDAVTKCMGVSGYVKTWESTAGKDEYLTVLQGARSVGCLLYFLIEHSFHTNKESALWLMNDENLDKLAKAEADAINEYFEAKQKSENPYNINIAFRTLQKGMNGPDVESWQSFLKGRGIKGADKKELTIDGDFGTNTEFATIEFQKQKNILADGIAGPITLKKGYRG